MFVITEERFFVETCNDDSEDSADEADVQDGEDLDAA